MVPAASDPDRIRRDYESSLSWRVTRPLRAAGRMGRALRGARALEPELPELPAPARYDSWLEHFHGDRLAAIDAACAGAGPEAYALFRELDVDLWALLLTQQYDAYPNIRALLPGVPEVALQEVWNGASGVALAAQSAAFYDKVRARQREHGDVRLADSRLLDFGCGWGRLTRFFARDVEPGCLYGCDPVEDILEVCRKSGVPATLRRTDFVPERLPFEDPFDLAFSFSVFTHISEAAHESCLRALHASLRPGALLIATIRAPGYLEHSELIRPVLVSIGTGYRELLDEPRYLFAPHPPGPRHLQYDGGEMTYGETVITMPYVRERWSPLFELVDVDLLIGDLHQVMLTLRRR